MAVLYDRCTFGVMQAIVTATSESYLKGTKVLLYSFLKHHPTFQGDFVVINDELPASDKRALLNLYPIRFLQVTDDLKERCKELADEDKKFENSYRRFWSVDSFRLTEYSSVLFLDSDMLCRGSLEQLFNAPHVFSASPDISTHQGLGRDRSTFEKRPIETGSIHVLSKVFNAGMFCFKPKLLPTKTYEDLLKLLNPDTFASVQSGHTDQYLLNRYLEERVHWLNARFNYLLRHGQLMNVEKKEALLWHYLRNPKPWKLRKLLRSKLAGKLQIDGLSEWQENYQAVLRKEQKRKFKWTRWFEILFSKAIS